MVDRRLPLIRLKERLDRGMFVFKKNAAHCRCCNIDIGLSARGNPVQRAKDHINSKDHKSLQLKCQADKTKDISSFFAKKEQKTDRSTSSS